MEKVQYAIEIVNRWSAPMNSFERRIDAVNAKKIGSPVNKNFHRGINQANNGLRQASHNMAHAANGANMFSGALKMLPAIGAAAVIYKIGSAAASFTKDSIMAAAAVEKYSVTLKTMLGSQGAARDRMQEYFDIAAKTPFQLDQVIQAGNQLQAIGEYSRENLTNLGDLAAASGKPIEQVMGAYAKLATGQKGESVNMFRDLLISVEDWTKATGKGVKANGELEASTEEMLKALPAILKAKGFLGMMGEQAKTTEGQLSNLEDSMYQLKVAAGDRLKPTFDSLIRTGSGVIDMFKDWVEVPLAQKIADEKAELNSLVGAITDSNVAEETRKSLIDDLLKTYPEFLGSIDAETVSNEQLRQKLVLVNKEYDLKIKKEIQNSNLEKLRGKELKAETEAKKYRESMAAREQIGGVREEAQMYLKSLGISEADLQKNDYWKIMNSAAEGRVKVFRTSPGGGGRNDSWDLSTEKMYQAQDILYRYKALDDLIKYRDDDKLKEAERKYNEYKTKIKVANDIFTNTIKLEEREILYERAQSVDVTDESVFDKLFGSKEKLKEFEALRGQSIKQLDDGEWQLLAEFLNGGALTSASGGSGGGSGGNFDLSKAEDTISGGGRNMKVINISLDSLIANNTNIFEPGQDPADASEFLDKLLTALQLVVNDTNYNTQ